MMKSLTDCYELNNGVKIPCIGFGTWQTPDGDTCVAAVKEALAVGYRHIDTAAIYRNEVSVGKAIKESGVPRNEIFLTTKLWNTEHGYETTKAAFNESLKRLDTDYFDLYLIHWPNPKIFRDCWAEKNAETWRAFEELYAEGKIRAIGISNFMVRHMEPLMESVKVMPAVNQIRLCPGETQDEVVKYCCERNMLLQAYSPLGTGKIFDVPEVQELAKKYNKSIAQICVRWSLQMGFLPLPKTAHVARVRENSEVFDFELSYNDVKFLAGLKDCCGLSSNPDETPF